MYIYRLFIYLHIHIFICIYIYIYINIKIYQVMLQSDYPILGSETVWARKRFSTIWWQPNLYMYNYMYLIPVFYLLCLYQNIYQNISKYMQNI